MDPNVKKILNNGGFIAALAPVLAARSNQRGAISVAATRLGEVAGAYSKMLAAVGVTAYPDGDWEGCEQAQLLMRWINHSEDPGTDPESKAEVMADWTATIWSACADLAAGKLPT